MMISTLNLWNPDHVTGIAILVTALLLGMVHGITPDEHTWPITFSYAIGSYSTKRGFRSGLIFSAAFTLQRAIASELAYLGLSHIFASGTIDYSIYVVVGILMAWAGLFMARKKRAGHLHLPGLSRYHASATGIGTNPSAELDPTGEAEWLRDPRPWMPAVHGFVAGWGFGAFAVIIYTILAPAMHSAAWGWVPGALFGLGTTLVQIAAGALFGWIAQRRGLPPEAIRSVALKTASKTLTWGGGAFVVGGIFGLAFPGIAGATVSTGVHVHNLDQVGLPLFLVVFAVMIVGMTTLVHETRAWKSSDAPAPVNLPT